VKKLAGQKFLRKNMNKKINILPVGKYINKRGEEGIRYIWSIDGKDDYYIESGAFPKRTKLGKGTIDEQIAAYTTSVSLGCILSLQNNQCKFCVTGNNIPFYRLLTVEEIALQNVFMVLDDDRANTKKFAREFAYMGQGEPAFSYNQVKKAIIITDKIMHHLAIKTYRHIFATSGVPYVITKLTKDLSSGYYGKTKILLHLSINAFKSRDKLMPINSVYPIKEVIAASEKYSKLTGERVVVNLIMFKKAILKKCGPFTTISLDEHKKLKDMLNPKHHRIVLCEYNYDCNIGKNGIINSKDIEILAQSFKSNGFTVKKFKAFGKKNNLACGLLGGKGVPNLSSKKSKLTYKKAVNLVNKYSKFHSSKQ